MEDGMSDNRNARVGILAGGNWIIDQVKIIDVFPQREQLANIRGQEQGTGGAPYNVLLNLAKLGVNFPLWGAGYVGADALGEQIRDDCHRNGIRTDYLRTIADAPTSYTDVMTEITGGRRTFFHHRGANAHWDGSDLAFAVVPAQIFHLGYLLLLDKLDVPDAYFGTRGAALLAKARQAGLKTSIDVVSEDSDRFGDVVTPALRHSNYCIINEIEAGKTSGIVVRLPDGSLDGEAVERAAANLLERGVQDLVVIHFAEGAYGRSSHGEERWEWSLDLPTSYIAGCAGAGDAFCAGVLLGLHEGWDLSRSLVTGNCVAAASLAHATCTGGVGTLESALALRSQFGAAGKSTW